MARTPKKSTTKDEATKNSSKPKKKMGRPKKIISQSQFEAMCAIQCTEEEICLVLGVSDETLNKWCKETYGATFLEVFKQKRALGKMSLRRAGFNLAKKSAPVHIFYAKNYLGMTDHVEIVDNTPIERLDAILGGLKDIAIAQQEQSNADSEQSE